MNRTVGVSVFLCLSLLVWSAAARADMVWPGLVLVIRLYSIIPIILGLFIELLFLRYWFALSWKKAILVDIVMNGVSALVGICLIPIITFVWELGPGQIIDKVLHTGTFNPVTWTLTLLFAILITNSIESMVVAFVFKIPLRRWGYWILFCANGLSVTIAFISILISPLQS
jgi:hypothetical protein